MLAHVALDFARLVGMWMNALAVEGAGQLMGKEDFFSYLMCCALKWDFLK